MSILTVKRSPEKLKLQIEEVALNNAKIREKLEKKLKHFGCATLTDFKSEQINPESPEAEDRIEFLNEVTQLEASEQATADLSKAIVVESENISEVVDAAEELLILKKSDIFQRAGKMVRVIKVSSLPHNQKMKVKRSGDYVVIKEIDPTFLTEHLTKTGIFLRLDARGQEYRRIPCPEKVARHLLARQEWKIPVLVGIINAPTLRVDGSILETPGYDPQSGIFFFDDGTSFAKIPSHPTKEDAFKAYQQVESLLKDFPFDNEISRSVAVSAIMCGVMRKSISTAPLHCFTAPKMASGKSLLADVVSLIATGKANSVISHADNETEERKRLMAVLLDGDPIVCFDNIEEPFGSSALCSILTQTEYKDRVLGETRSITVPTNVTFLATGNNLVLIGDLSTRALISIIDPNVERPEERSFSNDLRKFIPENRHLLVPAILTIIRAYYVAKKPKQNIKPYGRFEEYSDTIRSALVWLGKADPCESRKEIENADPVRVALGNLLSCWYTVHGNNPKTVKELISLYTIGSDDKDAEALHDALCEIAPDNKGGINERKLGKQLSKFRGRIENGYRLDKSGSVNRAIQWIVKK